jgi:hypothetical protein
MPELNYRSLSLCSFAVVSLSLFYSIPVSQYLCSCFFYLSFSQCFSIHLILSLFQNLCTNQPQFQFPCVLFCTCFRTSVKISPSFSIHVYNSVPVSEPLYKSAPVSVSMCTILYLFQNLCTNQPSVSVNVYNSVPVSEPLTKLLQ